MSTLRYCDGRDGECRKTENDVKLYEPADYKVAQKLVERRWFSSKYDIHICEDCLENYYNEGEENLVISESGEIELGKDFKIEEK